MDPSFSPWTDEKETDGRPQVSSSVLEDSIVPSKVTREITKTGTLPDPRPITVSFHLLFPVVPFLFLTLPRTDTSRVGNKFDLSSEEHLTCKYS